jgi:hypothetical protein
MSKPSFIALAVIVGVLVGCAVFLAGWDIPPPTVKVEKTLPDGQFPR